MKRMRVALRPGVSDLSDVARSTMREASIEFSEDDDSDAFTALVTLPRSLPGAPYASFDDHALNRAIEDGILAIVRSVQRVLPKLSAGSRIIHIAPCNSANSPGSIGTALVEAAIIALTRSTADEFRGSRIAVNAILPRAGGITNSAIESTLEYLLRAPTSVTGLSLVVPCRCKADST